MLWQWLASWSKQLFFFFSSVAPNLVSFCVSAQIHARQKPVPQADTEKNQNVGCMIGSFSLPIQKMRTGGFLPITIPSVGLGRNYDERVFHTFLLASMWLVLLAPWVQLLLNSFLDFSQMELIHVLLLNLNVHGREGRCRAFCLTLLLISPPLWITCLSKYVV